ncbi:unnamed protein product [Phytophthora lilii]|uniref:Unnamed protein product n=1 Tax=Phytophthora lilii TaxID=2077276 RepID=A0A9W6X2S2_9STRA|nr:unnamed protein product [Phytophthora lilii]
MFHRLPHQRAPPITIPTQAFHDRDFPRLNGRYFVIWKTRVTAALEGKNILGFVSQVDYAGDFDFDFSDDEELNPALSDMRDMKTALDAAGAPKADDARDPSSSESSSHATATDGDDGDVDMGQGSHPMIQSFSATKQEEKKKAEKLRAKSLKQSSKRLRRSEAKAKAFLIKTINMFSWSRTRPRRLRYFKRCVTNTKVLPYMATRTTSGPIS